MVKVTAKKLLAGGACSSGIKLFKEKYPRGVYLLQGVADVIGSMRANLEMSGKSYANWFGTLDVAEALDACAPESWRDDVILAKDYTAQHSPRLRWRAFYYHNRCGWVAVWGRTEEEVYNEASRRRVENEI